MPTCRTCSLELPAGSGRGRPASYCSAECRRTADSGRKREVTSATDRRIQALLERIEELERRLNLTIPEKSAE
jgi:hypothetical protein